MNSMWLQIAALGGICSINSVQAQEYASFSEAVKAGKPTLQLRPRLELVYQDSLTAKRATAMTVRTALGYETGNIAGLKGYIEFEDVRALVDDYHVPLVQPNPKYATVGDPELTQVNQAYLAGYGFKIGRQKLVIDNARFIGDVGWRQNDQTFDAIAYQTTSLIPATQLTTAYATQVNGVNGQSGSISLGILDLKTSYWKNSSVGLSWIGLGGREQAGPTAALKTASRQYAVLHLQGKQHQLYYDVSYGRQKSYRNSEVVDADYRAAMIGIDIKAMKLSVQREQLDPGFNTPLATLHAYNGWADKFLVTPVTGLTDTNIKLSGQYSGFGLITALHRFESVTNQVHFGDELDISISKKLNQQVTGLAKLAHYQAAEGQGNLGIDQTKFWMQLEYRF